MKLRYWWLGTAVALSLASLLVVGNIERERALRPLSLEDGIDPVETPFRLIFDEELRSRIDIARELASSPETPDTQDTPEVPDTTDNTPETPDTPSRTERPQRVSPLRPGRRPVFEEIIVDSPDSSETPEEDGTKSTGDNAAGDGEAAPEEGGEVLLPTPEDTGEVTRGTAGEFSPGAQVGEDWFDDALFIGDSRTDGLRLYSRVGGADYFCSTGLKKCSDQNFSSQTLESLLDSRTYGKIFIGLGINECGSDHDSIMAAYAKLLRTVREKQPGAVVILEAIMTTSHSKEAENICYGPANLNKINRRIAALADGSRVFYIDVNELFADSEGYLPESFSGDGCHLSARYYPLWVSWIRCAVADIPIPSTPEEPTPEEPAPEEPTPEEPTPEEPAPDEPTPEEPTPEEPAPEEPAPEEPTPQEPAPEEPAP